MNNTQETQTFKPLLQDVFDMFNEEHMKIITHLHNNGTFPEGMPYETDHDTSLQIYMYLAKQYIESQKTI